jgi:hypothetical protein
MKAALARHYIEILSIGKDSLDAKKLLNYKAPTHALKVGVSNILKLNNKFVHSTRVLFFACTITLCFDKI